MQENPAPVEDTFQRLPLYQQAVNALRTLVSGMSVGEILPSERLLAQKYKVGLATIREAVRILASEGRVERKQGKGTFVAAPSKKQIAITISQDVADVRTSSVYLRIAQEVRRLIDEKGLLSRLYIGRNPHTEQEDNFLCPEFFRDLEAGEIQGVIGVLLPGKAKWVSDLKKDGVELVGLGADKPFGAVIASKDFLTDAVRELKGRGRRRLAFIGWRGFDNWKSQGGQLFREVLQDEGLPVVESWIKDDLLPVLKGSGWSAFREIWSANTERPEGLVVFEDLFLGDIAAAAAEMGVLLPQQLEIAAPLYHWQNRWHSFPLVAYKPDVSEIARALVEAELKVLNNETPSPAIKAIPNLRAPELDRITSLPSPEKAVH